MALPTPSRKIIGQACNLLEQWTGFSLRESAPHRIAETFQRRAASLDYADTQSYLSDLARQQSTDDEPQRLINLITNGLTAFWRDEPQLSALRSILRHLHLPGSLAPISIWCAGVSTGEEAYTVAMIADEEKIPVEVLGTDLNTDFLRTARAGQYSSWSLRRLDDHRRNTYLTPADDDRWAADHRAFDVVRFTHHNLLTTPPRSRHPDGHWDIILCRNVLIYFSPRSKITVLNHLASALTQQGYLIFGSSEQIHPEELGYDAPALRSIRKAGGFLYRPGDHRTGHTIQPGHWLSEDHHPAPSLPTLEAESTGLDETTSDAHESDTVLHLLLTAHDHLEAGELDLALACLEASLGYNPFQVESHCLMGSILRSLGAPKLALEALQKALFLEPEHWFAAHHMAMIHYHQGDLQSSRRAFRQVLAGLDRDDDPLATTHILQQVVGPLPRLRREVARRARTFLDGDTEQP